VTGPASQQKARTTKGHTIAEGAEKTWRTRERDHHYTGFAKGEKHKGSREHIGEWTASCKFPAVVKGEGGNVSTTSNGNLKGKEGHSHQVKGGKGRGKKPT